MPLVASTDLLAAPLVQWERALQLLDDMRARGVAADTIAFTAGITACQRR
jgi:hypothetical protein